MFQQGCSTSRNCWEGTFLELGSVEKIWPSPENRGACALGIPCSYTAAGGDALASAAGQATRHDTVLHGTWPGTTYSNLQEGLLGKINQKQLLHRQDVLQGDEGAGAAALEGEAGPLGPRWPVALAAGASERSLLATARV